ncbi:MAG: hypothetical protein ACKVUT_00495 [Gaiella sp.]
MFLFVNDDLIEEIGGEGSVPDFVARVEQGPPWVGPDLGLCQKAVHSLDGWRERELDFPPYLGYLGLFVLAVGVQGAFAAHAYYSRLRTLLGWPDVESRAPASFDRMLRLWEDLEVWSNQDKAGTLGVFSIRIAGEWIHVGLPKAQAVLTEHERRALPAIFAAAILDSTAPPSDPELIRALRRHGANELRQPTLELLSHHGTETELLAVLLDAVRDELEDWDGAVPDAGEDGQAGKVIAMARVCLRVDEVAARATATLRVAAKAEFPEDGLALASTDGTLHLAGQEYQPGWSSPLRDTLRERDVDASALDWSEPLILNDDAAGWRVRLPSARLRIFVSGLPFDLPGFVEIRGLPGNRPFVLAASSETAPALNAWTESGQVDLHELRVLEGLPQGWKLFKSAGAHSDQAVRAALPELTLPAGIRLKLAGGIRSGEGNTFFRFAPPTVIVEGGSSTDDVLCNGRALSAQPDSPEFALPGNLPHGERIMIEVRAGAETVRRQALFLSDDFAWKLNHPLATVNQFGTASERATPDEINGAGLGISGVLSGQADTEGLPVRATVPSGRRAFAIGRHPGQITSLPGEGLPTEWQPIWIVELERRGRAVYCGRELANAGPLPDPAATRDDVELWKDILWHRRKRITPPEHPLLRKLWTDYVEAGRRV